MHRMGRAFVKFRATWVAEHNSGDGSARLKASVDFKKKFERLISEQMEQHEWEEAGDSEFVPVGKWDPKLDGKLEPEKSQQQRSSESFWKAVG